MMDFTRANHAIMETKLQPFGYNAYNPNEEITDFVGRAHEISEFKQYIQLVNQKQVSLAVRLEGPAGVGKSTLFNYIKEEIEKERTDESQPVKYLEHNVSVISAYFRMPEGVTGFRSVWQKFSDSLKFEVETGEPDIGFPEYVALNLIQRLLTEFPDEVSKIIWKNQSQPDLRFLKLPELVDIVLTNASQVVPDIQAYFEKNKRKIRNQLKCEINGNSFEITRNDTSRIIELFSTLDEDSGFYERINNADREIFPTDDTVIEYFNDLRRYYICASEKNLILLLGIDEIVKYDYNIGEGFYEQLGRMFVKWRDSLKSILFVFISTTDDWNLYDQKILKVSDLHQQVQVILKRMVLKQLSVDDCILIFENRMRTMWKSYASDRPSNFPYYPYTDELFEYVLRYHFRNLRDCITYLHRIWMNIKATNQVTLCNSKLKAMKFVRNHLQNAIYCKDFRKLDWEIVVEHFQKSAHNSSNTARSSSIEKGMENAWKCIQQKPGSMITRVENNPKITLGDHERRPDVVVEILGQFDEEEKRRIEFQIKAYKPTNLISYDHIQSSLELFQGGFTDLLYFVMSGELDSRGKNHLDELSAKYPTRIRRPQLRENQIFNQYFLASYQDIVGWEIGSNMEIDLDNATSAITEIIGQEIDQLFEDVRRLTYRKMDASIIIPYDTGSSDISQYFEIEKEVDPTDQEKEMPPQLEFDPQLVSTSSSEHDGKAHDKFEWIAVYPFLSNSSYEAMALVGYLKSRESNSRFKNKYVMSTFKKNIIDKDASLEDSRFKILNNHLLEKGYVKKVKSSLVLTDAGLEWYENLKRELP